MRAAPDALTDHEARLLQAVGDRIVFTLLSSPLSYSAAVAFARHDEPLDSPSRVVIYELSRATILDECMAFAICDMIELSERNGRHVILSGLRSHLVSKLRRAGVFDLLPATQCFGARRTAIEAAIAYCQAS